MDLKRNFTEFEKVLLSMEKPSTYFNELIEKGEFPEEYPFDMISELKDVPQSKEHHPEGNVWNHTMLVVDKAAVLREKSKNPRAFMWAALLHDIGKKPTTVLRKGRYTAYEHDIVGAKMAEEFLKSFTNDEKFIGTVKNLIRYHMHILFIVKDMSFKDEKGMIKNVDLDELALLGLSDRLGRGFISKEAIEKEYKNVKIFLEKSNKIKNNSKNE
ncbi:MULTISPECIES: HDIG domain-containing metalloprotein [Clostridium]|uniref:HDIG domain-containing protein n=1 Tax=Clostridium senegalense TaxID=1465809 RepID=A0A6M0H4J0_9CLOT|nr:MULTISPECIES: HDIG domain-containing metalloprotein [Clostridium]NEU05437.1 HDIG domain-containing protein [Clostridium senegalense]